MSEVACASIRIVCIAGYVFLSTLTACAHAHDWPVGASFIGLHDNKWELFIVEPGARGPRHVPTVSEPRTPAYSVEAQLLSYISADGSVHEIDLRSGADTEIVAVEPGRAYTQLAYNADGSTLFAVVLRGGSSIDADLVRVERANRRAVPALSQRLAQFEPFVDASGAIYYSIAFCGPACGRRLHEVWRYDPATGQARQLTLQHALSREPVVSPSGRALVFSSDRDGNFHLWRMTLSDRSVERLTSGNVSDVSAAYSAPSDLYFIRRADGATSLMRLPDGGDQPETLELPEGITDLRSLGIDSISPTTDPGGSQ